MERNARQAYLLLKFIFTVIPIAVGLDKNFHLLTDWNKYLSPQFAAILGSQTVLAMRAAGVMEIIVGIGVALKPKIFSYVVFAWLCGIILNLLLLGGYYDVAARDLGLAFSALALAKLSATR
jgi:hypothetical protein